jgi:general secretion pathway protein E
MSAAKAFTIESITDLLIGYSYLAADQRGAVIARAATISKKLEHDRRNSLHFPSSQSYDPLPPEILAAMDIGLPHAPEQRITEDLIYELIARVEGMRYIKIDPLKLDAKVVTGFFSRPFARRANAVPIDRKNNELFVAVANPYDAELFENLQRITGMRIVPVLAARVDILKVITEVYGFRQSISDAEASIEAGYDLFNLEQFFRMQNLDRLEENDQHIVNAVDYIMHYAFEHRASDIHIEPKRDDARIRMRIDGILHTIYSVPKKIHPPMVSRIKTMSRLDIAERRRPQDGRMKMGLGEREIELRVSTVPTAFGEKAVLRILDASALLRGVDELGFEPPELKRYVRLASQPTGLVLVTGPTGSGKTTTLYASLRMLSKSSVNITTVEDPIEMVVEDFNQIAVQRRIDLDFANALKYILRQDPDIIMVGEIRDPETAENAVQAALTGHLVFSTLHTNDSVGAVARLRELGVKPYLISSTLNMVLAQRLLRTVCTQCKQETILTEDEALALNLPVSETGSKLKVWFGEGCARCRNTGLYGRTGIYELFEVTDKVRRLIKEEQDGAELFKIARQDGMITMKEAAIRKLAQGLTSFDEVMRILSF